MGIDAKTKARRASQSTIFERGLLALSYEVITVGPRVSLGYRTTLTAAAQGRLLTGARMGISKGLVKLDLVRPDRSKTTGWTPCFKAVFKASGANAVSAALGLPISLQCGIKIPSWDKRVGITVDPSIKATVQAVASIG